MSDMLYGSNIFTNDPDLKVERYVSLDDEGYSFDYRVVARCTRTGTWYTARDSGCSCPSPFEDFQSRADLTRVKWNNHVRWGGAADSDKSRLLERVLNGTGDLAVVGVKLVMSWDDLLKEARAVLAWTQGTATDRFYGTPPDESTIADYVKWLEARRREARLAAGRKV